MRTNSLRLKGLTKCGRNLNRHLAREKKWIIPVRGHEKQMYILYLSSVIK